MGDARHRRRGSDADLTATVLRRLHAVYAAPARGWVPRRPDATEPVGDVEPTSSTARPVRRTAEDVVDRLDAVPPTAAGGVGARRLRIAPSGRAVAGLAMLVALAVVTALVALWLARPGDEPVPSRAQTVGSPLEAGGGAPGAAGAGGTAAPPTTGAAAGTLLVHVVGAVRDPGVVELAPGSRVTDAVEAAGGVTRRAAVASINLARPVLDGEQVVVLRRGDPASLVAPAPSVGAASPGGAVPGGSGPVVGTVDLNSATLEQLDALPGIGPVLAQRILDWRTTNGRFSTVEELGEVSGIGEATLGDLRPLVRV